MELSPASAAKAKNMLREFGVSRAISYIAIKKAITAIVAAVTWRSTIGYGAAAFVRYP